MSAMIRIAVMGTRLKIRSGQNSTVRVRKKGAGRSHARGPKQSNQAHVLFHLPPTKALPRNSDSVTLARRWSLPPTRCFAKKEPVLFGL